MRRTAIVGLVLLAVIAGAAAANARPSLHERTSIPAALDPCAVYRSGSITDSKILGGTKRLFDRDASIYQVCNGFGAPDTSGFHLTVGMQCALVAAAAAYAGPPLTMGVDRVCSAQSISAAFASGGWINGLKTGAKTLACGTFSDVFAGGGCAVCCRGSYRDGAWRGRGRGRDLEGANRRDASRLWWRAHCASDRNWGKAGGEA
jgi:hypothetical protein